MPRIVEGNYLDGIMTLNGDQARFDLSTSCDCVVNGNELVFGTDRATMPSCGDPVMANIGKDDQGHYVVTVWTHVIDHFDAYSRRANVQMFKPSRSIPTTSITPEKPKNQNPDRRQRQKTVSQDIPLLQILQNAVKDMEAIMAS